MTTEILFEEIKSSNKIKNKNSYWILTGIFAIVLLFNLIIQKRNPNQFTIALFGGLLLFGLLSIIATIKFKLVTQIREDGIYIRFPPFQPTFNRYSWDTIQELYIRKYNAMKDYSGLGIRIGPMGRGFIVSGDTGLQIVFKDNSKLLITTQRPEEISDVLNKVSKEN